jgi:hypothetical protein
VGVAAVESPFLREHIDALARDQGSLGRIVPSGLAFFGVAGLI